MGEVQKAMESSDLPPQHLAERSGRPSPGVKRASRIFAQDRKHAQEKTIGFKVMAVLFCLLLSACSSSIALTRTELTKVIEPLLEVEGRYGRIMQEVSFIAFFGEEIFAKASGALKNHADVYWVYYYSASVALANGDLKNYRRYLIELAKEIDAMQSILEEAIGGIQSSPSDREAFLNKQAPH